MKLDDMIVRRTNFPPHEFAASLYMARPADWAVSMQSISDGSLLFGSSHRLVYGCIWLAGLPFRLIGSADVTLSSQLTGMHLLSGASMIWSYPWIFHCVGTMYGQMAEVYLLIWTCVCMIRVSVCFVSFLPLIQQFTGPRQLPPYFRLILTFSYCLHEFLREQKRVIIRFCTTVLCFVLLLWQPWKMTR